MAESFITYYNNAIFGYLNPDDTHYQHKSPVNCIKYIASGHLIVEEDGRKIHVRRGEYVFVRKNCAVNITKQAQGADPYGAITLNLEPSFLKDYFSRMDKNAFPNKPKRMHEPIMKIGILYTTTVKMLSARKSASVRLTPGCTGSTRLTAARG